MGVGPQRLRGTSSPHDLARLRGSPRDPLGAHGAQYPRSRSWPRLNAQRVSSRYHTEGKHVRHLDQVLVNNFHAVLGDSPLSWAVIFPEKTNQVWKLTLRHHTSMQNRTSLPYMPSSFLGSGKGWTLPSPPSHSVPIDITPRITPVDIIKSNPIAV